MLKFDAKKFKTQRKKKGFKSQNSFAEKMREFHPTASRVAVRNWEEKGYCPGSNYLFLICRILQCAPEDLMKRVKDKKGKKASELNW